MYVEKGTGIEPGKFQKGSVSGFYWIGDHGQQVVLAVEQGVVVENVECREEPMASGRHFTCVVLGLALQVADGIEDKGDKIQLKTKATKFSEGSTLDNPWCPCPKLMRWAPPTRADIECTIEQQRVEMARTCAVLYPIVVELVLKHIWEHEQGKTANFNYNVHSLFVQLTRETQFDVKFCYDQCCR